MKLNDWIRDYAFFDPKQASESHPQKYVWRGGAPGELCLVREDVQSTDFPLAVFRAALPGKELPSLLLTAEVEYIQDAVVTSLLVVARKIRSRDEKRAAQPSMPMYAQSSPLG
ncbi:unnamed protein product [Somion occarium]|uniref:DUF6593 domain-containing protein n=1 Tax=Somion occarium TaxID=3059160 RepID=A0ABP1D5G1_9APHY